MSTVYPKHHCCSFISRSGIPFIAYWLIGPNIVTKRALVDEQLGSLDDTMFVAKLSIVKINQTEVRTVLAGNFFVSINYNTHENR